MRTATLRMWMVAGLLAGVGALHGPGCANNADDVNRNGENTTVKGDCVPADDDGNPCTLEVCKGSPQEHVLVAGLPCGKNGSLKCDKAGKCTGCAMSEQCGDPTDCFGWTCTNKVCTDAYAPAGKPVGMQVAGDCKQRQCDGSGGEQEAPLDTDIPDEACQISACMDGEPLPAVPLPVGTACTDGGIKCDGDGNCVECVDNTDCTGMQTYCDEGTNTCHSCNDATKNGDETDVDCGGDDCPKCTLGDVCGDGGDCTTNFCVDGVCCDSVCSSLCVGCNTAGNAGQCQNIAKYGEDTEAANSQTCLAADGLVCNGAGACKQGLNTTCMSNPDCASNACADPDGDNIRLCLKATGDDCAAPGECASNMCTSGKCL
jgi:hypothetical protein